jgi:thiol-disulfide isomerase/thioredoxin
MPSLDLNHVTREQLHQALSQHQTIVACLCAEWCDVCAAYRAKFDDLAKQHPHCLFLWIDIEDQADLVDDLDIDNFPTLVIQQNDDVLFFGTMQPDCAQLHRMILRLTTNDTDPQIQNNTCCTGHSQPEQHHQANLRSRILGQP